MFIGITPIIISTNCKSIETWDVINHFAPVSNPALLGENERNDAFKAVSGVLDPSAVRAVGTHLELVPLFHIEHKLAENASTKSLERVWDILVSDEELALVGIMGASPLAASASALGVIRNVSLRESFSLLDGFEFFLVEVLFARH